MTENLEKKLAKATELRKEYERARQKMWDAMSEELRNPFGHKIRIFRDVTEKEIKAAKKIIWNNIKKFLNQKPHVKSKGRSKN